MIPTAYSNISYTEAAVMPSKTYRLTEDGHIRGYIDGVEALKQTVFCILMTQKYVHAVYPHSYGFDRDSILGENPPLVYAKIKNKIVDALMGDDRITAVDGFSFSRSDKKSVLVSFTVVFWLRRVVP